MQTYLLGGGSTDISVVIRIIDAIDGSPETAVVFDTAGIDLQYRREGDFSVAITEVTLAALTTVHTDGGFLHIGNGYYRLDLPDAACAAGVVGVLIHGTVTGMVVLGAYIQLISCNLYDAVRLGLTALPNVAQGNAGALVTAGTGTGQLSVASGLVTLVDASLTAVKIATDAFTAEKFAADFLTAAKLASDVITELQSGLATAASLAAVHALLDPEIATILAAVDTEVAAIKAKTDQLVFTGANRVDVNLEAINNNTAVADTLRRSLLVIYKGDVTGGGTPTTLVDAGLTHVTTNQLNGRIAIFEGNVTAGLRDQATPITGLTPASDTLAFEALTATPLNGDRYVIL